MTTKDKSHTPTQTELIEAELEPILDKAVQDWIDQGRDPEHVYAMKNFLSGKAITLKKDLAALVLKHRHDVYFAAYRDGLQQGRVEGQAILESAKQREVDLTIQNLINYGLFTPEELDEAVKKMNNDTPASK